MKTFENPEIMIEKFSACDVIATSGNGAGGNGENGTGDDEL